MKLRIEISEDMPCEVIIRCKTVSDEVRQIQKAVTDIIGGNEELTLSMGNREYFVPVGDIMFFETDGDKVAAHTASNMYYSDKKLYELERLLPSRFVRVSKSCILDSGRVSSIGKSPVGSGEVMFFNSHKKTYVSRMYYKVLKDVIYETRLSK